MQSGLRPTLVGSSLAVNVIRWFHLSGTGVVRHHGNATRQAGSSSSSSSADQRPGSRPTTSIACSRPESAAAAVDGRPVRRAARPRRLAGAPGPRQAAVGVGSARAGRAADGAATRARGGKLPQAAAGATRRVRVRASRNTTRHPAVLC